MNKNDVMLCVNIKAYLEYRLPPESTEEEMNRKLADQAIAHLAYQLQDEFARLLLKVVEIKAKG